MQVRTAKGFLIKAAFLAMNACSSGSSAKEAGSGGAPAENQVLFDGVRVDRFERDRLRHRAHLAQARLDRASGTVTGEVVEAQALEGEEVRAEVRAPRMRSELKSRTVTLEGGVTVTDHEGKTLRTETLTYDSARDWLETSAPVSIEGENFHATGGRLTGHARAGRLEVEGPAAGRVLPKSTSRGEP